MPVRVVRDFVNTAEPELGTDRLAFPTASECLQGLGLLDQGARLVAGDLPLLVGVREGLREVLLGHGGHDAGDPAVNDLDELLRRIPLTIRLVGDQASVKAVEDRLAHHVIATVLSAVLAARAEDWVRLKVCARDSCRWAFYDTSRNRSGRWCSMAGCGNVVKMRRAYRTRKGKR